MKRLPRSIVCAGLLAGQLCRPARPSHAGTDGPRLRWDPPRVVADLPLMLANDGTTIPDIGTLGIVAGGGGIVHLLWAGRRTLSSSPAAFRIDHRVLEGGEWRTAPPVKSLDKEILALTAAADPRGDLVLLWAEGSWPGTVVRVARWSDGAWGGAETVSDPEAEPFVLGRSAIDLSGGEDGTLDLFWEDHREGNFIQGLLSMGHAGTVSKTFHRRHAEGQWTGSVKIQKHGPFDVENISAVRDMHGNLHLFWTQEGRWPWWRSGLLHAKYGASGWNRPEKVGDLPPAKYTRHEFIGRLEALPAEDGSVEVLWVRPTYAKTLAGESLLEVWSPADGGWKSTVVRGRRSLYFRVPKGAAAASGVYVQECTHAPSNSYKRHDEPWEHPIAFLPRVGDRFGQEQAVVASAGDDLFDAAVGPDGVHHLVYAARRPDSGWSLVYLRGSPADR